MTEAEENTVRRIGWGLVGVGDGDFDLHSGFDADGGDLLDDLRGRHQVDEALVDLHLKPVPGLRSLTARSLTRGDPQSLQHQVTGKPLSTDHTNSPYPY